MQNNISSSLIFNINNNINSFKINKKCSNSKCEICKYLIYSNYYIFKNFKIPIMDISNCLSTHVIYIIICIKCKCYYIGESGRSAHERIGEHLKSIPALRNSTTKSTEISKHFNLNNHNIDSHFRFAILRNSVIDKYVRRNYEADIIHIFKTFNLHVLNEKIIQKYNLRHMFFTF